MTLEFTRLQVMRLKLITYKVAKCLGAAWFRLKDVYTFINLDVEKFFD